MSRTNSLKPTPMLRACRAALTVAAGLVASALWAATPTEMKAAVQEGTGGPEVLRYKTVPVPQPAAGQVLVKIYAASINPVEWKMRSGMIGGVQPPGGGYAAPNASAPTPENTRIPGSDAAGVIEQLGAGVTRFKVGDAVVASIGRAAAGTLNGSYAQYAVTSESSVYPKPTSMSFAQASGLGTATTTGVRAVTGANIVAGQRVLVAGAAGGVGSAAVQAAKARGAHVIGTASARHNAYLKSIGVDEIIDYKQSGWESRVSNVDVAIDTVSAENALIIMKTLKKGGRLYTFNGRADAAACAAAGVECPGQGPPRAGGPPGAPGAAPRAGGAPGGDGPPGGNATMEEVLKLVNDGKLKINVDASFPLEQAGAAQEENRNGGTQGKIVLIVDAVNALKK